MFVNSDLTGKVALVLGGSRGIGAAIVARLARDGADVALTYRHSAEKAEDVARDAEAQGRRAVSMMADSGDPGAVAASIDETIRRLGRLDILVINAGIATMKPIDEMSLDEFDALVAINFRGVFAAIRSAAPRLGEGGRIVTIGSNTAERAGFPGIGAYAATKAAVAMLVRGAAIDLAKKGITVNNVQPGPTATDMTAGFADLASNIMPIGRMGEPDEVASLVAYLVRDEARFVTGTSLTVDGGYLS